MKKLTVILAICLTGLLPPAAGADEIFSLKAGYLTLSPSGSYAGTEEGFGTSIDLEGDLDFDASDDLLVEAALQLGPVRLSAAYLPLHFSGSGALTTNVVFNGETFAVGETVDGDVDADLYDLGLAWYLLNLDDLPVRVQLGPEVSAKVVDADLTVKSRTTGLSEEVSGTVGIPTVGARLRLGLADWLALVGRVGYVEYDDNSFLDADGQLEFSPFPLVGAFAGYRHFDIEVDESDIVLDAEFSGPYAGAFLRF